MIISKFKSGAGHLLRVSKAGGKKCQLKCRRRRFWSYGASENVAGRSEKFNLEKKCFMFNCYYFYSDSFVSLHGILFLANKELK